MALHILGLAAIAGLGVYVATYLDRFFSAEDTVSKVYLYFLGFLTIISMYGLLLFRWGSENEIYITSMLATALAVLVLIGVRKRSALSEANAPDDGVDNRSARPPLSRVLLMVSSLVFSVTFLIYQGVEFPKGFDGGWQFVRSESLLLLGRIPEFELGTLAPPFYQRGYHVSVSTASLLTGQELGPVLKVFNIFLIAMFPFAAWFIAYIVLRSRRAAGFAALSSMFLIGPIILQGAYPMLMSFHFLALGLGASLHFVHAEKTKWPVLAISPLVGLGMVATHPVMAEIYLLFGVGLFLFVLITPSQRKRLLAASYFAFVLATGVLAYAIVFSPAFSGQIMLLMLRFSYQSAENPLLTLVVRTATMEGIVLFLPVFILPPVVVGLLWFMRKKAIPVLAIFSVAMTAMFMQVLPLNGREPFVLFLPLTLLAGAGLREIFRSNDHSASRPSKIVLVSSISLLILVSTVTATYIAYNPVFGQSSYLSADEVSFAQLLRDQNLSGGRFASLNDPAMARIGALSDNHVLVGDKRFFDLEEFRAIYFLLFERDCLEINAGITNYQLTGVLLRVQWGFTSSIVNQFGSCLQSSHLIEHQSFVLLHWENSA